MDSSVLHRGAWVRTVLVALAPIAANAAEPALRREPITYASDGLKITGLLSKPPGDGPFPLIVVNHGGYDPATSVAGFLDLFSQLGYVAIASDYRGVGRSEGRHELARGEVNDVLNAVTYARTLPYVDGQRVVMFGISHGGCIALLAAARDPTIKGIVDLVGPIDLSELYRYWVRTQDELPVSKTLTGLWMHVGGSPDQRPEEWNLRSPIHVADRIKCPVYLIYGAKDDVVLPEQGEQMAAALRAAGNPHVTLIIDAEAGHGFDAKAFDRVGIGLVNFLNKCVGLADVPPKKKS